MGAKDLYLLQLVQHSANETDKKPSQWAFFIAYTDKSGMLTGAGEIHEIQPSSKGGHKYVQRHASFFSPTFRGASTLGLFYKKNLYKIYEALEEGNLRECRDSMAWVEDRLEALRRPGVVLLGPTFQDMARKAYKAWKIQCEDAKQQAGAVGSEPSSVAVRDGNTSELVKKYYCFPYTHYATP